MQGLDLSAPGPLWLAAGVVLLVLEVIAPGAFMMWLGIAALGTGLLVHYADPSFDWQVVAFAVLSGVGIAAGLWLRRQRRPSSLNTPESGLIGRSARVLSFQGREGRVRLGDSDWSARLSGNAETPLPGVILRVVGVDASVLLVAAMEGAPAEKSVINPPLAG